MIRKIEVHNEPSHPHQMGRCNITNDNLHNHAEKTLVASLVLLSKTNQMQLFNKLAFHIIALHWMCN